MKVIIIGGVAGGASAAARLRRLDETAEIILLERGEYVSYANCGLPYYIGGEITQKSALTVQTPETRVKKSRFLYFLNRDKYLYLLLILPLAYYAVFRYGPMYGVTIAFKDYNIFAGISGSDWVGLDVFREVFKMKDFFRAVRNTFMLNALDLVCGFPIPIILALILNEVRVSWFKRVSQSILYIPYFLSWIVIGCMLHYEQVRIALGAVFLFLLLTRW